MCRYFTHGCLSERNNECSFCRVERHYNDIEKQKKKLKRIEQKIDALPAAQWVCVETEVTPEVKHHADCLWVNCPGVCIERFK